MRLMNCFVTSDVKLQRFLAEMRWEILKDSLKEMHFEDALTLKMTVINFRLISHMFDFEQHEEIYDTLNEIEVARHKDAVRGEKLQRFSSVLTVFLQTLAVIT